MDKENLNLLIKFRLVGLKQSLHVNNGSIGAVLQIILLILFFVMAIFVPAEMATLLFVFPIINCIIALIVKYYGQNIKKELDFFEDSLEFSITEKITYKLFNEMIKDLDRKKYRVSIGIDDKGYVSTWAIYDKKYNELITNDNNSISDLLIFVEEHKNDVKRSKKTNGART